MNPILAAFNLGTPVLTQGLITGMVFALLATGLVLVHRSSGVINFAHAELGLIAAAMVELLVDRGGMPFWLTMPAALGTAATLSALCEVVVIRRLRKAPKVMTVVATLGLSQLLLFVTAAVRGSATSRMPLPPGFPEGRVGTLFVNRAASALLILGPLSVAGVAVVLARTRIGREIRGAAANPEAARLAGLNPARAQAMAWGIAGMLAGLSSILVTGAVGAASASVAGPALLVPAIAAAVLARFRSIGVAFAAGIGLGVFQEIVAFNVDAGGAVQLAMFVVVLVGLLSQRATTGRDTTTTNWMSVRSLPLPAGARKARAVVGAIVGAAIVALGLLGSSANAVALMFVVATAAIGLSVYVVTGLGGQLSLGQFAVGGVGAVVGVRVAGASGDLLLGLLVAGVVGAVVTVLIGLPGLRLRGLFAAVTTLAFAVVCREWLLGQTWMAGFGRSLDNPKVLGIALATSHSRFAFVVVVYGVMLYLVSNVSKSGLGRRIRALRDNEPQARGFAIPAFRTRAASFAFAGFIAGASGILFALAAGTLTAASFPSSRSITVVAAAVLGGLQGVFGSLLGAFYLIGIPEFLPLDNAGLAATSFGWLALLLVAPQGLLGMADDLFRRLFGVVGQPANDVAPTGFSLASLSSTGQRAARKTSGDESVLLRATGLQKHYGGVRAVDGVDLQVKRGETVGLIGGNGAGKTTLFELLGGFASADSGRIEFKGLDITKLNAEKRAALGMVRSFQDAGLFATFTVREAVAVALERRSPTRAFPALVGIRSQERSRMKRADELLAICGLSGYADHVVSTLSTGTRRITELACMIALEPELLLLDEPSAGIAQRETEALVDVIKSVRETLGTTVVVIEHDMPFIRALSDRIIVMETGRVLAEGTPETVLADERVISSYLGTDTASIERSGNESLLQNEASESPIKPQTAGIALPAVPRRWTLPTADVRTAQRKRWVTMHNRRLGWVTLVWMAFATVSSWAEPRWDLPKWVAFTANNLFTVNLVLHGVMSAYVYRMPRPRSNPRIVQVYLGYGLALFTVTSQSLIGVEPMHSVLFAILWLFIVAHVAMAIGSVQARNANGEQSREAAISDNESDTGRAPTPKPNTVGPRPTRPGAQHLPLPAATRAAQGDLALKIPGWVLAAIATAVTVLGLATATRSLSLTKSGVALMPSAFFAIAGLHILLTWHWVRYRKPSGLRLAPFALFVIAGLFYDNIVLGLGNLVGEGNTLRALSVPRYWIHAIGTPLMIPLALEIGKRCGLSWAGRRSRQWAAFTAALILFGLDHDGIHQKLAFTTAGGVSRYANEAVTGPPVASVAVIAVVMTVAIMIWHRGRSSTMAVCSLIMLIGAAIGATLPLIGNLVEVFFVIAFLSGMQICAGHRTSRTRRVRVEPDGGWRIAPAGEAVPWTTISMAALVGLLGALHATANIDLEHGTAGSVPMLAALALSCAGASAFVGRLQLGHLRNSDDKVLANEDRTVALTQRLAAIGLFLAAVDVALLVPGNIVGATDSLRVIHAVRIALAPLAFALLLPLLASMATALTKRPLVGAGSALAAVVAAGGNFVCRSPRWITSGFVTRYACEGLSTPGVLAAIAVTVGLLGVGILCFRRGHTAPLILGVGTALAVWGGLYNPMVFALAPLAAAAALAATSVALRSALAPGPTQPTLTSAAGGTA